MRALLIRSRLSLQELADRIYGDIFHAKYEGRQSLNKGGLYYRAYGLFCDFSLVDYDDGEFLIITDSKAMFDDEESVDDFYYRKIKTKLNYRDIESEIIEV
jgi:hypothetical protein